MVIGSISQDDGRAQRTAGSPRTIVPVRKGSKRTEKERDRERVRRSGIYAIRQIASLPSRRTIRLLLLT